MKKTLIKHLPDKIVFLLLLPLVVFLYYHFFLTRAYVEFTLESNVKTKFKIYWSEKNSGYSEVKSAKVRIKPGKHRYDFYLTDLANITSLRIDPAERSAELFLYRLAIRQRGLKAIVLGAKDEFARLKPLSGIKDIRYAKNHLRIICTGNDSQMELKLAPQSRNFFFYTEILLFLLFIIAAGGLLKYAHFKAGGFNYVPYLMTFILGIILVMACVSRNNQHPDEFVHVRAASYFEKHWFPPAACTPETEYTYSPYGVSRLNSLEIVYWIAGKFSAALSPVQHFSSYLKLRLFNVTLFLILVLMAIKIPSFRIVCLPLIISPQIWYVFSYFNSDAFSLFIIFLLAHQVVEESSLFNRYITGTAPGQNLVAVILLGLLAAISLLIKKNCWIVLLFLIFYILWKIVYKKQSDPGKILTRIMVIALIGGGIVFARIGIDETVNSWSKSDKVLACREKLARTIYNPKTPLEKQHIWMKLKTRGVSLKEMFKHYRWGEKSFRSAFGVFGYMTISSSESYYNLVRIVTLISLFYIVLNAVIKGGGEATSLTFILFALSGLLIGAALWRSWTVMLQAQGRYLLPISAMLGIFLFHVEQYSSRIVLKICTISMFGIALYAFVLSGLYYIPKF